MTMNMNDYVVLSNGVKMPIVGFGTCPIDDGFEITMAIKECIKAGYRHIDTAAKYDNEKGIGVALRNVSVDRSDIFVTGKVWHTDHGYEETLKAFTLTINKLQTGYLDLYLMHYPDPLNTETWRALEHLYKNGFVRAIGVSNFKINKLQEILDIAEIKPMVNQIEFHPQCTQNRLREYCHSHNIQFEAWSPLIRGTCGDIVLLQSLADKYNKTVAQIVLRWDIQLGVVTIPKTINPMRMTENLDIFDFVISDDDMALISGLDQNKSAWNRNWDG